MLRVFSRAVFVFASSRAHVFVFVVVVFVKSRLVFAANNSNDDVNKDNNTSDDGSIAAIERRLKNSKNKVKLTSKEKQERDSGFPKTNDAKKGRPATLFDDLGMKRSFPTPGANGMLSNVGGGSENWERWNL